MAANGIFETRSRRTAAERLFDLHFDRLHSLFRLSLAQPDAAEAALLATLRELARSAPRIMSKNEAELTAWVDDVALAQLARERRPTPRGVPDDPPRVPPPRRLVRAERELLDALDDATLTLLVRGLEGDMRVAVALGLVHGIDRRRVALVLGCAPERVELLQRAALGGFAELLSRHPHERFRQPRQAALLARTSAPHLRPLGGRPSDGVIVVRGTKAMVVPGPPHSLYELIRDLLSRLVDRIRRREAEEHLNDEVGTSADGHSRRPPPPTPTTQPFRKPARTPSLTDYRKPEATRGTSIHERSPKETPGTQRIGSPRRTVAAGGNAYAWTQTRGGSRKR